MKNQVIFTVSIATVFLGLLCGLPALVSSHDHSHDTAEFPAYKYSREANAHAHIDEHDHNHAHGNHMHGSSGHNIREGSHSHDFGEVPSFKYSREANIPSKDPVHESRQMHEQFDTHKEQRISRTTQQTTSLWLNAIGSTLLVSTVPFFILFFIPLDNTDASRPLLKVLLSFAAGGLLGDGFFHLIPHAQMAILEPSSLGSHVHSHGHSHDGGGNAHDLTVGLWVLSGIVTFLVVEKLVHIIKGGHSHSHVQQQSVGSNLSSDGGVNSSDSSQANTNSDDAQMSLKGNEKNKSTTKSNSEKDEGKVEETGDEIHVAKNVPENIHPDEHSEHTSPSLHEKKQHDDHQQEIKVAGYLNLVADFIHNLTDGLAIGASYLAGHSIGVVTTMTIVLHEVPHEIGDFAILVQSGVPRWRAIMLQLTTALGALTGTVISLLAEGTDAAATSRILGFTAGGFIYIATVTVIPELLERSSLWQSVKELLAMLVGMYMMVLIAEYE